MLLLHFPSVGESTIKVHCGIVCYYLLDVASNNYVGIRWGSRSLWRYGWFVRKVYSHEWVIKDDRCHDWCCALSLVLWLWDFGQGLSTSCYFITHCEVDDSLVVSWEYFQDPCSDSIIIPLMCWQSFHDSFSYLLPMCFKADCLPNCKGLQGRHSLSILLFYHLSNADDLLLGSSSSNYGMLLIRWNVARMGHPYNSCFIDLCQAFQWSLHVRFILSLNSLTIISASPFARWLPLEKRSRWIPFSLALGLWFQAFQSQRRPTLSGPWWLLCWQGSKIGNLDIGPRCTGSTYNDFLSLMVWMVLQNPVRLFENMLARDLPLYSVLTLLALLAENVLHSAIS